MNKIIIFTQNTMASTVATRQIVLKNHDCILAIVLARQLRGESFLDQLKLVAKLIKKSSLQFAIYKIIESYLYSVLLFFHTLLKSKKYKNGSAISISNLAKRYNIAIIKTNDISNDDFLQTINKLNPNYIFCIVGQVLKKNVFEILGNKLLNAHGSYLPEYRGPAQYFWYLLNNHKQFGITLHFMNAGLDTGNIIFQQKFDFAHQISAYRLHYMIAKQFGSMFNTFIELYGEKNEIPTIEQNNEKATQTHLPTKKDIKRFNASGNRLIRVSDFFCCT